nr:MAG TPA: hypothetical protein [Caudoviricetes sp.]
MNDKQYGLTSQTVLFYSDMVRCGFDWGLAMTQLKELYDNNKAVALGDNKHVVNNYRCKLLSNSLRVPEGLHNRSEGTQS